MAVRIGHASIDENNKATGGNAGDQTNKEVCIRNWYLHNKGWVVLRCNDETKRKKIAEAMEKACANNQIGYDQNQRDTLFNNVKDFGFDPSKTTKNVETDCSALVRVCIAYAYGKDVVGNIRTISEPSLLVKSGLFTKYTSDKYCKSSDYLLRGDILCTPVSGHTVVVLDDGAPSVTTQTTPTTQTVDIDKLAQDVIAGKYGSGAERKAKLGSQYDAVQKRVNELLSGKTTATANTVHTVKAGESLWTIARNYLGDGNRYPEIVKLNNLKSTTIRVGQKLIIPNK